jgi:hypothetical protein|tara:strand:+ start:2905 stop:3027 length:123 start_codon:yes stop_codon:yes gene_type:complete
MKSLNKIVFSLQEIWAATRPNVYKNKKKYTRKEKHKSFDK